MKDAHILLQLLLSSHYSNREISANFLTILFSKLTYFPNGNIYQRNFVVSLCKATKIEILSHNSPYNVKCEEMGMNMYVIKQYNVSVRTYINFVHFRPHGQEKMHSK